MPTDFQLDRWADDGGPAVEVEPKFVFTNDTAWETLAESLKAEMEAK